MTLMKERTRFDELVPRDASVVEATGSMWDCGLLAEEEAYIARAARKRVREFTAGRNCARAALALMGVERCAIGVAHGRAPLFPRGFSGTITHTDTYCAAAVVRIGEVLSLGIDAETNEPLSRGVVDLIALPDERVMLSALARAEAVCWAKLLFSIKEAFYKAYFQLTAEFLDFREAQVSIDPGLRTFTVQVLRADIPERVRSGTLRGAYVFDQHLICTAVALGLRH
jgi:4'-phosphopantetheinyl transferase EntD